MSTSILLLAVLALMSLGWHVGRRRALAVLAGMQTGMSGVRARGNLHSRPVYHGILVALWCGIPALAVLAAWLALEPQILTHLVVAELPPDVRSLPAPELDLYINDVKNLASGNIVRDDTSANVAVAAARYLALQQTGQLALTVLTLIVAGAGLELTRRRIAPRSRARNQVEHALLAFFIASSSVAIFTTVGIVLSVLFEAFRFFEAIAISDFLFGLTWSPQTAIRADQVGASGAFGAIPLFAGTALIAGIAMAVAVPVGLMSAIYLSEYADGRIRSTAKPMLEILAGIPTVVYGFFAALTVAPWIRDLGTAAGLEVASESALAAGLVMGVMIIPFVSSISDDVINAVPQSLRDGALALGATRSEMIRQVVFPAALPGIVGGVLLAVSRAIGETMIVVMAAGLAANLTANPLSAVTTVTAQMVALLVGDQEFDSPKTLAAFALGLTLFLITLALNIIALRIVRAYREQYE